MLPHSPSLDSGEEGDAQGLTSQPVSLQGGSQPTLVVRSKLMSIQAPCPFVVVSQGWPSALTTACSLRLHVWATYFRSSFHKFFEPDKLKLQCWLGLDEFQASAARDSVLMLSGDVRFVRSILNRLASSDLNRENAG